MIVVPTIDRQFQAGEFSTISDHKDNVHWFQATSEKAYIFNIHVLNIDPDIKQGGRVYIDPQGEPLADGRIRAKKISYSEAYKRYGNPPTTVPRVPSDFATLAELARATSDFVVPESQIP